MLAAVLECGRDDDEAFFAAVDYVVIVVVVVDVDGIVFSFLSFSVLIVYLEQYLHDCFLWNGQGNPLGIAVVGVVAVMVIGYADCGACVVGVGCVFD